MVYKDKDGNNLGNNLGVPRECLVNMLIYSRGTLHCKHCPFIFQKDNSHKCVNVIKYLR